MSQNPLGPRELNRRAPSAARAYDHYLGGAHNFEVDRDLAAMARAVLPCVDAMAQLNRSFLRRAVRFCVDQGITQFLDLGSGIPTVGNVHEIAQSRSPQARVVYVDYEPVAYTHARAMLSNDPLTTIIQADIRDVDTVLGHPEVTALLDFDKPVGLLMVGVLLFVPDHDDPGGLVARYNRACAAGSLVALSHISDDEADPDTTRQVRELVSVYRQADEQVYVRTKDEFASWFDGTELIDPGVVALASWRPDGSDEANERSPAAKLGYAGVGRIG